mgnify:FL=1
MFGAFPDKHATESEKDFIRSFELAGGDGVSEEFLANVFAHKKFTNVELIKGDICETVPAYIQNHSALKIALLHIDVDVQKPTEIILQYLYEKVVPGGVIVFDDYGIVEGETRAVDNFVSDKNLSLQKLPLCHTATFMRKQ